MAWFCLKAMWVTFSKKIESEDIIKDTTPFSMILWNSKRGILILFYLYWLSLINVLAVQTFSLLKGSILKGINDMSGSLFWKRIYAYLVRRILYVTIKTSPCQSGAPLRFRVTLKKRPYEGLSSKNIPNLFRESFLNTGYALPMVLQKLKIESISSDKNYGAWIRHSWNHDTSFTTTHSHFQKLHYPHLSLV